MNWISQNRGYIVCAVLGILVGAFGVLWLKKPSRSQIATLTTTSAPVQPVFIHDTTVIVKRLAAIDTLTKPAISESIKTKTEENTPLNIPENPCPPFKLHLSSSPDSSFALLDSVSVDYLYPAGSQNWSWWGRQEKEEKTKYDPAKDGFLSLGLATFYHRYQNNLSVNAYVRLQIHGLNYIVGYHHQTRQQLSLFFGVQKEWKIF